jgi:DNA-binding FadR family transcriptional regulator
MNTVTVQIDVTRPAGRKLIRELEAKKCVVIKTPNPGAVGVWHKWEDVAEKGFDKLTEHYGTDMRKLSEEYKYIKK